MKALMMALVTAEQWLKDDTNQEAIKDVFGIDDPKKLTLKELSDKVYDKQQKESNDE